MKTRKTSTISTRIDDETRIAFYKKARKEPNHDASSVLRALISLYLTDSVQLERTVSK